MASRHFTSASHLLRSLIFGILIASIAILSAPASATGWVEGATTVPYFSITIPHPGNQTAYAYPHNGTPPDSADAYCDATSSYGDDHDPAQAVINLLYSFTWQGTGGSSRLGVTITGNGGTARAAPFLSNPHGHWNVTAFSHSISGTYSTGVGVAGDLSEAFLVEVDADANGNYSEGYGEETTTGS